MKDQLTYGFNPEYSRWKRRDRLELIESTRQAVKNWNEAMGFKILRYQSDSPDIIVSEMTKKKLFQCFSESERFDPMNNRYTLSEKLFHRLLFRIYLAGDDSIGLCYALEQMQVMIKDTDSVRVVIHELGHALGLPHSDKRSIMYPKVTERRKPSSLDQQSILSLIKSGGLGQNSEFNECDLDWFCE